MLVLQVNFSDIRARTLAEQRRQEQQELRKQKAMAAKLEKVRSEFAGMTFTVQDFGWQKCEVRHQNRQARGFQQCLNLAVGIP